MQLGPNQCLVIIVRSAIIWFQYFRNETQLHCSENNDCRNRGILLQFDGLVFVCTAII